MFTDNMVVYIANPIVSTKRLLFYLLSEFGKVVGYKVSTQKWIIKKKTREKIPFTIATRKIKYLGIDLTKKVKDLYKENYRTLKKEIEEDTSKWKHSMFMD